MAEYFPEKLRLCSVEQILSRSALNSPQDWTLLHVRTYLHLPLEMWRDQINAYF